LSNSRWPHLIREAERKLNLIRPFINNLEGKKRIGWLSGCLHFTSTKLCSTVKTVGLEIRDTGDGALFLQLV
jgi:hypothetical protein